MTLLDVAPQDVVIGPSPVTAAPTGSVKPPVGVVLPADFDATRQYVTPAATWVDPPYVPLLGPLTATPGVTLAQVVERLAEVHHHAA